MDAPFFSNGAFVDSLELNTSASKAMEPVGSRMESFEEAISHWSGYYSINPELTVALVDFMPLRSAEQIRATLMVLFEDFYKVIQMELYEEFAAEMTLVNFLGSTNEYVKFYDTFARLYPKRSHRALRLLTLPYSRLNAKDRPGDLALPYGVGSSWYFSGVHTWTGADDGSPMSAIDMAPSWDLKWGDNTGDAFVTASHHGFVTVLSSCLVCIASPDGHSTLYYHLDRVQVKTGQYVQGGDRLGNIASRHKQGLCDGGSAGGPHVRFAFLNQGFFVSLNDVYLSAYQVNSGGYPHDSSESTHLTRDGRRYLAYKDAVPNDGRVQVPQTPHPRPSRVPRS